MNLFDNIINQSKANFLGTQSTQTVPSFMQPQAPRTTNYIAPAPVQTKQPVLFANEKVTYQKMLSDGLSEQEAQNLVKQHRDSLYPIKDFTPQESATLRKMASDWLTSYEAIDLFKQNRQQKAKEWTKIQDMHADEGVVEQTLKAPFRAIGDVTSQTWQGIGKGTEWLLDASFRGVNDLNKMIGSSDYSPELEKALPQGGYLGDVAKIGAGTTSAVFNLGKAPLALGINTANQLPWAQYITQGIGKWIEYGAEQLGWLAGLDKGTSMDIATTGMNLLGMKPWMNTIQYGKGIANAQWITGIAGAIVKPVWSAVVDTVKMPYDIAKWVVKWSVKLWKSIQPAIASTSDAIQTWINRMTKWEINKFQAEQGVSPWKYLNDRGIVSSGKPIEETLLTEMKASRDQATAGMDAIVGNYKMPERPFWDRKIDYVREMLMDNYSKAKNTLDAEGTTIAKQLLDKYDTEWLSMSEINQSKRKMAENNPVNWLTDSASDRVQTVKRISDEVRNWQFEQAEKAGFTNLKEINKQTQALYKLHEWITKWNDWIEANNKISLTDYLAFDADPAVFVAKKVLSNPTVRQWLVKWLNKISGRVVKPMEKATIGTINTKRAEYDYGNRNNNTSNRVDNVKPLALSAPSNKSIIAESKKWLPKELKRPWTVTKEEIQATKQAQRQKQITAIEKELNTNLLSKYNPNKPKATKEFLDRAITQGRITKEEAITLVENLYEKADWWNKPHYERMLNDLYSNKKIESWDDLLNEKQVKTVIKTPRQEFLETPEGIYREIQKKANDRRYNPDKADALIAKFKEKTGIDLMTEKTPNFDKDWNVVKVIKKPTPNTIKNESNAKQQGIKPKSTTTNVFGETIDKPSNSKGGFIKIPEIGKKVEIDANKFVKSKNPDITLTTFEWPDEINLYRLEIPKSSRKEWKWTKAMADLIEYADKNWKRITLTPDNYAWSSISRLKEFYKRFWFVENTGRNKDFSTRELMYRTPKLKPEPKSPVKNPLVEEARKTRFIEDSKKALQKWSPRKWWYEIKNIKLEDTNVYPAKSRYDTPVYKQYDQYKKSDSVEYWMKRIKEWDTPPPVVVEKRWDKFYVWDWHHRMVAAEESGLKNIDAIVIEKPLEKWNDKKFISFSEKWIENLTKKLEDFYKSKTIK